MAQQKMHGTVHSTYSGYQKVSDGEIGYSLRKSLVQDNLSASSEDSEISSFSSRNSNKRCPVVTLFEPVGWRFVPIPLQCLDESNHFESRAPVNMDGLQLLSPSSINTFKVDRRKGQKGPPRDVAYSVKSFTRPISGADLRYQYQNRTLANKVNNKKSSINSSSCSSLIHSNSSDIIPLRSHHSKSSAVVHENSKVDNKGVKRNSRKKAKKKGKQNTKRSPDTVFAQPQVFTQDYNYGSLTSTTSSNNYVDHSDGLVSYATSQDDSFSDSRVNTVSSESPKTSTSSGDEVYVSEAKEPSSVHNFPGEPPIADSEIEMKMNDQRFSITDGGVEAHSLQSSYYDGVHLNGLSGMYDSQVLDLISFGSNSDISTSSCDAKPYRKPSNKNSLSEAPGFSSRKGQFSPPNVDFCDYVEDSIQGNQGFNSIDVQVVAPGKKGKQSKMLPRGSGAYTHATVGHVHGRTGKENNHSVWQRVQKKDVGQSNSEFKKLSPVCSQTHVTVKEASLHKRNFNVTEVDMLSKAEDDKQLKDKVSGKSKRKTSPSSKKEYNSYSQKSFYTSKASSNACAEISVQQNEILDVTKQVNDQKRISSVSRSQSQIGCPEVGINGSSIDSLNSELFHSSEDCRNNLESHDSVSDTISGMEKQSQDNSLVKSCCSVDKLNQHKVRLPVYLPHLIIHGVTKREKDVPVAEHSKQNQNQSSGSFPQKWVPIGTKELQNVTSTRCDRQGAEDPTLRNSSDDKADSHSQHLVSSLDVRMRSMALVSESITSKEDENKRQKLRNMNANSFQETSNKRVTADCVTSESKDINLSSVETDSDKVMQAVNDVWRMQLASEAVQMATGGPIAEFERLLHFTSPVICQSCNLISCKNCSPEQVGSSLCRHETPDISLGNLWQWYEKHGSFGLEIKAEEIEQSKRMGVDRFAFRAYFVPFLSAIQLFRNSKSPSIKNSSGASEARCTGETLKSSSKVGYLPMYSLLAPQSRTSASAKEDLSVPSIDMTCSNDPELLFEYFECEQPWQRQPLYEKIQELANGGELSKCQAYGDPSIMNSINLHDLHPRSWYSVAWYPIYRIPDGNFRAAFLTYHSFGHMVHRGAEVGSTSTEACIVSPVVGLQSYNAQSECWFKLRPSAVSQGGENSNSNLNPSGILKEQLRTLEKTASLMARAVVKKGDQKSVNRHPDYEFFLSRRRNALS